MRTVDPCGSTWRRPLGMAITLQSRLSSTVSIMTKTPLACVSCLLGRDGFAISVERRLQRMPGQGGALHTSGKFSDAGKHSELTDLRMIPITALAGNHAVKILEQVFRFAYGFSLQALRHHRRRGPRNGATGPLERNVLNNLSLHCEDHRRADCILRPSDLELPSRDDSVETWRAPKLLPDICPANRPLA